MAADRLTIHFAGSPSSAGEQWLNLEQYLPPEYQQSASLADISAMVAMARGGLSARLYKKPGCLVTIDGETVQVVLPVYVWPSSLTLPYTLRSDFGTVDGGARIRLERSGNVVMPMAEESAGLPYLVDLLESRWDTPCYNQRGETITEPEIAVVGNRFVASTQCFGVIRASFAALGYLHNVVVSLTKPDATTISNLEVNLLATWLDVDGKGHHEQLALTIPQCVLDYLSWCDDGRMIRVIHNPDEPALVPVVYYSTCDGEVIEVRYE